MKYLKVYEDFHGMNQSGNGYDILCQNDDLAHMGDYVKLMMHGNEVDCYIKHLLKLGSKRKKQKGYDVFYHATVETLLDHTTTTHHLTLNDCEYDELYFVRKLTPNEIENSELYLKKSAELYNL